MATDLRRIPGVEPGRRRRGGARHRDSWSYGPSPLGGSGRGRWSLGRRRPTLGRRRRLSAFTVALTLAYAAAGLYGLNALRSFTHADVQVDGLADHAVLTSAALIVRTVRFEVDPARQMDRVHVKLDGAPVAAAAVHTEGPTVVWRPGALAEGAHEVTVSVPRPGMGDYRFHRRFSVDDTAPAIDVPALVDPVDICAPVTVRGRVEPGSTLTLDGRPVRVAQGGAFTLPFDHTPGAPLELVATDVAGNQTSQEVIAPVRYPGGQGVHVTDAAWGYEPLRKGIISLIDAGLVSTVELDLKDESGIVGYDSHVPLANTVGAVRPEFKLRDTVAELKRRGVRVIGRVVAFRDPPLAKWAWDNGKRDWVVQTADGTKMLDTYGGFTNPASPEVHQYNLAIALEAADAGIDDILWDYVRRPEGDPATMRIPGLPESTANAVVTFLSTTQAALHDRCVYQGASVFGIAAERPDAVGQDIPRMARYVDYLAPMLYPSHWVNGEYKVTNPNKQPYDIVKAALADFQAKTAGTGIALTPWLQDFSLGQPYGPAEVRAQIDAAAGLGVTDWLLWNAGAVYTSPALSPSLVQVRS